MKEPEEPKEGISSVLHLPTAVCDKVFKSDQLSLQQA